ncbi:MAG: hypothetical protein CVV30_05930 [Methanomicrobiales archaeon HGW-Methanomicrobiales-1]|nr:MAG: hypothetical protein CVV30_05930 [Methanomicrobiales archaeon HGW-Methanomicrobiales-1]
MIVKVWGYEIPAQVQQIFSETIRCKKVNVLPHKIHRNSLAGPGSKAKKGVPEDPAHLPVTGLFHKTKEQSYANG